MEIGSKGFKILKVEDTRQYEEINDRWKPIPGSGMEHDCHRCGKTHEVLYTVECLETKEIFVVGGSCAKAYGMSKKKVASLSNNIKKIKKLEREIEKCKAEYEVNKKAYDAILELTPPEPKHVDNTKHGSEIWVMGDAQVWCSTGFTEERKKCLLDSWRHNCLVKQGFKPYNLHSLPGTIRILEDRLEKIHNKIDELFNS